MAAGDQPGVGLLLSLFLRCVAAGKAAPSPESEELCPWVGQRVWEACPHTARGGEGGLAWLSEVCADTWECLESSKVGLGAFLSYG